MQEQQAIAEQEENVPTNESKLSEKPKQIEENTKAEEVKEV